jgi:prepilin-type N-terminal cleavage/methylation domain-containing protein
MNTYTKKNNFSLIEVLVAISIITICFGVFLSAISLNLKDTAIAQGYIIASMLGEKKITEILADSDIKVGEKKGDFGKKYPDFNWKTTILQNKKEKFSNPVEVKIFFKKGGNDRTVRFKTLLFNHSEYKKHSKK